MSTSGGLVMIGEQQAGTSAEDRHLLMSGDYSHGQLPSSAGALLASAASAAPVTSSPSPGVFKQPTPPNRNDKCEWDEDISNKPLVDGLKKLEIADATSYLAILRRLMKDGSWQAIADKMEEARECMIGRPLNESLVFTTYHVLALMKLQNYAAAQDEFLTLGDLNSSKFLQHSENYPNKTGSVVPFALRWLHAELPHQLGQPSTTIDRLYDLLAYCNEQVDFLQNFFHPTSGIGEKEVKANEGTSLPEKHSASSSLRTGNTHVKDVSNVKPSVGQSDKSKEQTSYELEVVDSNFLSTDALEDDDFSEFVASPLDVDSSGNIVQFTLLSRWQRRQEVVLCSVLRWYCAPT